MGKISLVSAKYIVHVFIQIEGVVDKPDVIGAIFGQTEGLLGNDLELRELQRSGKIGRIEVNTETKAGKTAGAIILPSSMDKAETAIIAASLETIQRIGPCNSRVKVERIEDVRISKRNFVVERAKELLRELTSNVLPDSQEITDEVANDVRMMEVTEYGRDRLPAGPNIEDNTELILVEGRADVLNLLKNGIKNVISINGTSLPDSIIEISKRKTLTLFVDGDRGGDLIIKEALDRLELDYIAKAPDGKEVEELTKKELHKALRGKIAVEQAKLDYNGKEKPERPHQYSQEAEQPRDFRRTPMQRPSTASEPIRRPYAARIEPQKTELSLRQKQVFKKMLDDLIGTRGAYILDPNLEILGKVPTIELPATLKNLKNAFAVVFDGVINKDLTSAIDKTTVKYLVAMDSKIKEQDSKIICVANAELVA